MDPSKVEVLEGNGKDGDACPHSSGPSSTKNDQRDSSMVPSITREEGKDSDTSPHPIGPWPNKCNQDRKETPNKSVIQQTCQTIFVLFFLVIFLVPLLLLPRNNITAEKPAERERSELFLSFYLGFSSRSPPISFIDSYYYCSIFFSFFLFFGYVNY